MLFHIENIHIQVFSIDVKRLTVSTLCLLYLLFPDGDLVPAHGTEPQQLRLLLAHPLVQVAEADQQRAPVLRRVLQPGPGEKIFLVAQ